MNALRLDKNCVPIHLGDFIRTPEGHIYEVMEYCDGWIIDPFRAPDGVYDLDQLMSYEVTEECLRQDAIEFRKIKYSPYMQLVNLAERLERQTGQCSPAMTHVILTLRRAIDTAYAALCKIQADEAPKIQQYLRFAEQPGEQP